MDFGTGAIGALIPKLGKLLKDEYDLQKSVKGGIKFLIVELESIQAALEKVSSVPVDQLDKNVRLWARDVREMSYDMEDSVDTFLVRIQGKPAKSDKITGFINRTLNLVSKARIHGNKLSKSMIRHKIAVDIMDIKDRVKEAKERLDRYKVDNLVATPVVMSVDPRLQALYKKVNELMGIEETRDELITLMNNGDDISKKHLKVISVVGIGGLGKTTLAKAVHDKIKVEFECCAFVSVGQNPNVKKVLMDVLYELDKQTYGNIHNTGRDQRQLIETLLEFLDKKDPAESLLTQTCLLQCHVDRYFIVIDDIWDTETWEIIKLALVRNNLGSRIIITTRIFYVSREAGEVYKLRALSDENSKKLFYTRIYGAEGICPDNEMDDVPDKILTKCGGVPLAIITMPSVLSGKPRDQWFDVYGSISFSQKANPHMENTMKILSYSYYDMPPHLRTCLLYLSLFPEDHIIEKDPLIWKWIAEGFIHGEQSSSLFEVGERYFNDLANRSLIQPVEEYGQPGCRLHDMVLGLIYSLACEENFVTVFDDGLDSLAERPVRRMSCFSESTTQIQMGMARMRSFIAKGLHSQTVPLSDFNVLRVLDLEFCLFLGNQDLRPIGGLLHMRYLRLIGSHIRQLPKEIGALKFLQTLDCDVQGLPSSVGLLERLLCLHLRTVAPEIGKLTSLENLEINASISEPECRKFLTELGKLTELRVLHVNVFFGKYLKEADFLQESLMKSLRNLRKLRHLYIAVNGMATKLCGWMRESPGFILSRHLQHLKLPGIYFDNLPAWISSSHFASLTTLSLRVQYLSCSDMRTLGKLPELCHLELHTSESNLVVCSGDGYFQKLRYFSLHHCAVMFWRDKSRSPVMKSLEALEWGSNVSDLMVICFRQGHDISFFSTAIGLQNLASLEKITINLWCQKATLREVEELEAALRHTVTAHPNHPTLQIRRHFEFLMNTSDKEIPLIWKTISAKVIDSPVRVASFRDTGFSFNFWNLPRLERVNASIYCEYATPKEVQEAEASLRRAVDAHPHRPAIIMERYNEHQMEISFSDKDEQVADHDATTHKEVDISSTEVAVRDEEEVQEEDEQKVSRCEQDEQPSDHDGTTQNEDGTTVVMATAEEVVAPTTAKITSAIFGT